MNKMKLTNDQTAFDYALYMIASSYFEKATCRNHLLEQKMLVQFKEQKLNSQYAMEETCIRYMEELEKRLPWWFFLGNAGVWFEIHGGRTTIVLKTEECALEIYGTYRKNHCDIGSKVWIKKPNKYTKWEDA